MSLQNKNLCLKCKKEKGVKIIFSIKKLFWIWIILIQSTRRVASASAVASGLTVSDEVNDQPSKIYCQFNKKEYSPGDVWYPPVPLRSTIPFCIKCTCLATGKLNCTQGGCPTNCEEKDDPCCKTCPASISNKNDGNVEMIGGDIVESSLGKTSRRIESSSMISVEIGETDDDGEEENVSCLHQGKIYKDGDAFTANVSGLPIASIDQCMQCQCQKGMVLCAMKSCSTFKCSLSSSTTSSNGETCCQRCAAWKSRTFIGPKHVVPGDKDASQQRTSPSDPDERRPNKQEQPPPPPRMMSPPLFESSITFRDFSNMNNIIGNNGRSTQKQRVDDCISSGIFYLHGSNWHPVIGPFGPMECVSCTCTHGQVVCGRLKCPHNRELPCTKPIKVEGHCCPVCVSPNDKTIEEGTSLCVSVKQDITCFKSSGIGLNDTEYIEFAFLRPRKLIGGSGGSEAQVVERHEWRLTGPDIEEFSTQYLTLGQFDTLRNRQAFALLGATNEKNVEKFTRREKKLEKRCTSICKIRISRLERSLRLHKLISRTHCLGHERMVHTV